MNQIIIYGQFSEPCFLVPLESKPLNTNEGIGFCKGAKPSNFL